MIVPKSLRLPPEIVERITEWRSRRRPIPSESDIKSGPSTHFPGGTAEIWFTCR